MVVVAFFAANAGGAPVTTIRSTFRRNRSAASSGSRSSFCSANRYSMVIFFPSIHPSLLTSRRNALQEDRDTSSSAIIQETYAEDLRWLLRLSGCAKCREQHGKRKANDCLSHRFLRVCALCYLITLSARASTLGGIVRPICLAAFRLMMNSNFVGCSTGRSPGLVPFKILST